MNGAVASVEPYLHRLELFRRADYERDAMVTDLVKNYKELQVRYEQKCIDFDDAVESRRVWQSRAMQSNRDLTEIQRATVRFLSSLQLSPVLFSIYVSFVSSLSNDPMLGV